MGKLVTRRDFLKASAVGALGAAATAALRVGSLAEESK